jgi:hypothetical protein
MSDYIKFLIFILIISLIFYTIFLYLYFCKINKLKKNRQIIPLELSRPELLNKPLNEFYFNSHNSYLSYLQHFSIVKTKTLKDILNSGVRCIELDISHINNIPVVAHGTKHFITTTYLSFDKFLDIILEYGFNTSDPLILFLEIFNEDNEILMNNIKNILLTKLSTRIAKLSYPDDYIADKPIVNFLNKILIFGSNSNILSNIIYSNLNFINIPDQNKEIKNTNILGRVYKTPGF